MAQFKDRIRLLRKKHDLSQEQLGNIFGYTKQTVCNWEKGKRFPEQNDLKKIADYFKVTLDYLLGKDEGTQLSVDEIQKSLNIKNKTYKEPSKEYSFAMNLLEQLVKDGYIKDPDNIPEYQIQIILDAIKKDIDRIKKEKE